MNPIYDVKKEYINIENYSPFCHINEVSPQFRKDPFNLLFIIRSEKITPIHPDTMHDLGIDESEIVDEKTVFPTSSFRTVYEPSQNICYKVPLLRQITRGIRSLSEKELLRSEEAGKLLSELPQTNFSFLSEECHHYTDPNFNFIKRDMPNHETFPWFYVIRSQDFDKNFELKCVENIIKSWMFYASKGIFFESYHTQNILVDKDASTNYRDLSDVRSDSVQVLLPSYFNTLSGPDELLSICFDRSVCKQNLDHLFRYSKKLTSSDKNTIKELINSEIQKYGLTFPNYSMDYSHATAKRTPERVPLIEWRVM